jgi:hypothetical protein
MEMRLSILLLLVSWPGVAAQTITIQAVDRLMMPVSTGALQPLNAVELSAAVGEYESLALLVTAAADVEVAPIRVEGLPRGVEFETRAVTPYRRKVRQGEATEPYLLEAAGTVTLKAPGKEVYWLTLLPHSGVQPGRYGFTVRVKDGTLNGNLNVRPFRLRRDPKMFYGAFCGAKDSHITPEHMRDLHERGFDALQFFWGSVSIPVTNDNGRMNIDFSAMDRWMEEARKSGMRGPIVWSLGNDSSSHMENMLSQTFHIPRPEPAMRNGRQMNFSDVNNPELNRRLKELMLSIKHRAAAKKWPEIVFIIYDEPTERLMAEHENRFKFIKSFWPELRIYGVTMNRIGWAKAISHMVDIFVANGDFAEIRQLATETGKPFWFYGSGSSRDEAANRHRYGWTAWAHGAEAVWFWAYNYHAGDPYDDFDGRLADSTASMVWPARKPGGPLVYSVSWDGMREAADDMAYLQTLEWMLGRSRTKRAGEIRSSLDKLRQAIPSGRVVRIQGGDVHDTVEELDARRFVTTGREAVANWITEMIQGEKQLFSEILVR